MLNHNVITVLLKLLTFLFWRSHVQIDPRVRDIRAIADEVLERFSTEFYSILAVFEMMSPVNGYPAIPPEMVLRSLLIQMVYSIPSDVLLMECMQYDRVVRWFVGLDPDGYEAWDIMVFQNNRHLLLNERPARDFLAAVVQEIKAKRLLSDENLLNPVTRPLMEAFANPDRDWHRV